MNDKCDVVFNGHVLVIAHKQPSAPQIILCLMKIRTNIDDVGLQQSKLRKYQALEYETHHRISTVVAAIKQLTPKQITVHFNVRFKNNSKIITIFINYINFFWRVPMNNLG